MNSVPRIDQFCAGFSSGDAISNEALVLQKFLREAGFESEIFCEQYSESDAHLVRHFRQYQDSRNHVIIYHHSYSTEILKKIQSFAGKKILIFHNMTPSKFVRPYNRILASELENTWKTLGQLKDSFSAILADSNFNAQDLQKLGFSNIRTMPVIVPPPGKTADLSGNDRLSFLDDGMLNILFVGRIFPNKKHQDLIKTFYFFNKIQPQSRLILTGSFHPGVRSYTAELNNLINELELNDQVVFTGMISDEDLINCYKKSDLFLSMSEHEGFFVPLVESMHFELPVVAFASSVIPETMGESGALFYRKEPIMVSEIMDRVLSSESIRSAILESQHRRAMDLLPEKSLQIFADTLEEAGIQISKEARSKIGTMVHK